MTEPVNSSHTMSLRGRSSQRRHASKDNIDSEPEKSNVDPDPAIQPAEQPRNQTSNKLVALFLVVLSTLVILACQSFFVCCDEGYSESNNPLNELYNKYPQHNELWMAINVTFKTCTRTDRPGVILLLHNGNGSLANCMVNQTATSLSKLIGVNKMGEYLSVDGRNAHLTYERQHFLSKIMEQRKNLGVVVFTYLEEMDSELVKNLHFICDSDQNISGKAAIILVLRVDTPSFKDKDKGEDLARKKLAQLWLQKLENRFEPIIARITNIIATIDESITSNCP